MITQEEKELLLDLLKRAAENSLLNISDNQENNYEVDWLFLDAQLCIRIKEI